MPASAHQLIDFGIVVLLWLVQLIIYPSFSRIDRTLLVRWHTVYTQRITWIIAPLMLAQLGLALQSALMLPTLVTLSRLSLIFICWVLTYCVSIPLHRSIQGGEGSDACLRQLVVTNWPRTILWSLIFGLSFFL